MSRNLFKLMALATAVSLSSFTLHAEEDISVDEGTGSEGPLVVDEVTSDFAVMILGSGAEVARPTAGGRAQPSLVVFIEGVPTILIDAGGGSYERLAQSGVNLQDLKVILLSQLMIDNTANLTGMIRTVYFENSPGVSPGSPPLLTPLQIFGPDSSETVVDGTETPLFPTTSEYIERSYDDLIGAERYANVIFERDVSQSIFDFDVTDVAADVSVPVRTIYEEDGVVIEAVGVDHFLAPSVAYSISYEGHKFTYSGDLSSTTDNLAVLAEDSDVLVYSAPFASPAPNQFRTTPQRIAQVSVAANVDNLVLSNVPFQADGFFNLLKVRKLVRLGGYRGPLSVADDLTVLNIE